MEKNITIDTDIYKIGHFKCLPEDYDGSFMNGEPRIGAKYNEIVWMGMSRIIQSHLLQEVTEELIQKGKRRIDKMMGPFDMYNEEVWKKVAKLGYLPIRIKALPEGSIIKPGDVPFVYEPTEPWFAKNANTIESLLMHVWYPSEIASRVRNIKKGILPSYIESCTPDVIKAALPYAVIDFGLRGTGCMELSAIGGISHSLFFEGSDNIPAQEALEQYYGVTDRLTSIWATEHQVAMAFGKNHELEYALHQITKSHPDQPVAIVIDAWDQNNFVKEIICHPEVIAAVKAKTGRVIWRPDTDDPLTNMCRFSDIVGGHYGFDINAKGYKVIKHNTGFIQGDGMNEHTIPELFSEYIKTGWAVNNIAAGSGGGLLQLDTARDNQRWAIKPSWMSRSGQGFDVNKTPKSDMSKASKKGHIKMTPSVNGFQVLESSKMSDVEFNGYVDCLEPIFENGKFFKQDFKDIVNRANKGLCV